MSAPFVEQGGLATAPGPLSCSGTTMFGFWARADLDSLAGLCEATFAGPSAARVVARPFMPWVLITFVRIDRIVSEPFEHVGWLSEREAVVWVPTLLFRPPRLVPRFLRRKWLLPRHLPSAMVPCMWLDNPISIASGREVYGYPKSWGCMDSDPAEAIGLGQAAESAGRDEQLPAPPRRLTLDAFGSERYASREAAAGIAGGDRGREREPACRPLLDLSLEDDGSRAASRRRGSGTGVRRRLVGAALERLELSQLFLKQVRSATDPRLASSQEVVRAPATAIARFRARRLPAYRLRVSHLDSHPLTERVDPGAPGSLRLGLEADQRIALAFVARFDFRVELGEVLWRSR